MKAGRTEFELGARVRITRIANPDPVVRDIVGATGTLMHPFQGLMRAERQHYIAGILLDGGVQVNLEEGDEVVELPIPERRIVTV